LGEAAEAKPGVSIERFEPPLGSSMMDVSLKGQRDPDVNIREKE
jgi:hypothetical protein